MGLFSCNCETEFNAIKQRMEKFDSFLSDNTRDITNTYTKMTEFVAMIKDLKSRTEHVEEAHKLLDIVSGKFVEVAQAVEKLQKKGV